MIGTIIPVIITIFILTSLVSTQRFSRILEDRIRENTNMLSRVFSGRLDDTLVLYENMARDLGSATVTGIHIESTLRNFRSQYPQFSHVFYTPLDGKVLEAVPYRKAYMNMDFSGDPAWSAALDEGEVRFSETIDRFDSPSLIIYAPALMPFVSGREPSGGGMVVLVLPLADLFAGLDGSGLAAETGLFVADGSGTVLFDRFGESERLSDIRDLKSDISLEPVFRAMEEGRSGFVSYRLDGEEQFVSFRALETAPWTLGFVGAYATITSEIRKTTRINLFILLSCLAAGIVLIILIVHSVVKPIEELTRVAQQIAGGNRSVLSTVDTSSEVGLLSDSLNSMIYELRFTQDSLELTVEERTSELKNANRELNSAVEELNASNRSLAEIRDNLEQRVEERNRELRSANKFIGDIIDSMPSLLAAIDSEGRITQWNKEAVRKTGITPDRALGMPLEQALPQLGEFGWQIRQAAHRGESFSLPCLTRAAGGNGVFEEVTLFPLKEGEAGGAVLRIDDITDRVNMEEALRHSQKMEGIGQLTSGIAHDFNNMLGGIMGGAELLRLSLEETEQNSEYLSLIIESAEQASELTQKLLSFSRKSGRSFCPVDMHRVLDATLGILRRTLHKKVVLDTDFSAPSAVIMGDRSQLQNAFLNLGINADHAMDGGGLLTIRTREIGIDEVKESCSDEIESGRYLEVEVRDTGRGIAEDVRHRIFEPFFTTKEKGKGTGLGLAAVYGTVRQHRGCIDVESAPGEGTAFRLFFPLCEEEVELDSAEESLVRGKGKVLVAEDEPLLRTTLRAMLEELGYEPLIAENGKRALELYEKEQDTVAMALLDMIMPVMDGRECFDMLRRLNPDLPIVIASGYSREEDVDDLLSRNLDAFVHKPYRINELSRILAETLGKKSKDIR